MHFNSFPFLLLFLPITLLFFYWAVGSKRYQWSILWLIGTSLVFYGLWDWALTGLLVGSVTMNYALGRLLNGHSPDSRGKSKLILCFGIICNLAIFVFFKYFGVSGGTHPNAFTVALQPDFILPIALSFFTFQQIVYLVDTWREKLNEKKILNYFLYITFFPQLLAGPIIRPNEFFPQLRDKKIFQVAADRFAAGLTIFSFGLFKKVVLADGIARYANSAFDAAAQGAVLSLEEAWSGALSFTLQIYFDFSGYSDMAIGLGYLFGLRLPSNFESPYKASSLIDFWHRWHMTLSGFFRDYIYIPLGGNRKGSLQRSRNIMVAMLVGGIWHGASVTFIVWGGAHGICLVINHFWREFRKSFGHSLESEKFFSKAAAHIITFLTVTVLWVFFRAENLDAALSMIQSLLGMHTAPDSGFNNIKISEDRLWFLLLIAWFAPNLREIMSAHYRENKKSNVLKQPPESERHWYHWRPNIWWAVLTTILFIMSILELTQSREFIYLQF